MALEIGQVFRCEMVVEKEHSVCMPGMEDFAVLSTPSMIMLMEQACNQCMQPQLERGNASVGVHVDIYHDASALVGQTVWAQGEIIAIDGRKVSFKVTAGDENGEIGHGIHDRRIINPYKMMGIEPPGDG